MVRRFVRVGAAIPPALSAYYHHAAVSSSKTRVECPNSMEQAALLPIIDFWTVLESASASLGSETAATSGMEESVFWYVRKIRAPVVGECEEVATLKRIILSDMHARRKKERLLGPNPDWFGIRLAAMLCDPFTKTFAFGNKPGTTALARASALAVIKWMVERADSAKDTEMPPSLDGTNDPPTKRPRTFLKSLRSFASGVDERAGGQARSSRVSSRDFLALEAEWEANVACAVTSDPEATAFSWWRVHEQAFPRVDLEARYLLPIPATSVTSERVFSRAGRIITKQRARMTGRNADKYIVLSDNFRHRRQRDVSGGDGCEGSSDFGLSEDVGDLQVKSTTWPCQQDRSVTRAWCARFLRAAVDRT